MRFTATLVAAAMAGAASAYDLEHPKNGTAPDYVTEVVTAYTTYCPEATQFTHAGHTYTVTKATVLTITNCPGGCTVVKPATSSVVSVCHDCAPDVPAVPKTTEAPVVPVPETSAKPVHETPVVPVPETSAKPVHEIPVVPVPETSVKPVHETPVVLIPVSETSAKPVHETPAVPVPETSVEPVHETTAAPFAPYPSANSTTPIVQPAPSGSGAPTGATEAAPFKGAASTMTVTGAGILAIFGLVAVL